MGLLAQTTGENSTSPDVLYSTDAPRFSTGTDSTGLFTIKQIIIEGAKKTKPKVIFRDLPFAVNQQFPLNELVAQFARARQQLLNTGLFMDVVVALKSLDGYNVEVLVTVKERWYVIPAPFAKVIDRSIQDWIQNQGMDPNRIRYGIKVTHRNFTGRNDRASLELSHGYTRQVGLRYEGLVLDKRLHWSANISLNYGQNRDIQYATSEGRRLIYKNPDAFVHNYFRTSIEAVYRPAIKTKHTFGFGYSNDNISDTVFKLSPGFSFQQNRLHYAEVFYRMQYFGVDFIPYPTKGYAVDFLLQKKGFTPNFNLWQTTLRTWATWPLAPKWYLNANAVGLLKLPFRQPFVAQQFVGSGNMYLQGYEDYFIDGVAGGYTKISLSRNLINTAIHVPSNRIKKLNTIPVKVYAKVFGNTGYVYNRPQAYANPLNNRMLFSGGAGLDIILFYDFMLKLEWSWNRLGQNGLYLHNKSYL